MSSLRVIEGPRAGEQIEIDRKLVFGRYEADIVIDDPELSRRHLEIHPDGDGLIVEDLGSTNGTFVNEHPIDTPTAVGHGAQVRLGATVLEVQIVAEVEAGATRLSSAPVDLDATRLRPIPAESPEPVVAASAPPAAPPATTPPAAAPPPAAPPLAAQSPAASPPPVAIPSPVSASADVSRSPGAGQLPQELGVFKPPAVRRGGGLASRSWIPVVLSYGSAILTAAALVIYFAQR